MYPESIGTRDAVGPSLPDGIRGGGEGGQDGSKDAEGNDGMSKGCLPSVFSQ